MHRNLDYGTIAGLVVAFGGLYAAVLVEGGQPQDLLKWSSVILVLAGTCGAVLITTPLAAVVGALSRCRALFFDEERETLDPAPAISLICQLAKKAKKRGIVSLETDLAAIPHPMLRRALGLATDGLTALEVRDLMRIELRVGARKRDREARVFEAAGGYAPTFGILGAVLGLIQVMKHLDDMAGVGHGIAEAFVSTVYGLALANLILLPVAGKLRARTARWIETQELLADGVASVFDHMHPMLIEAKLAPYAAEKEPVRTPPPQSEPRPIAIAKGA
jgi:chemotaxis protein MotA